MPVTPYQSTQFAYVVIADGNLVSVKPHFISLRDCRDDLKIALYKTPGRCVWAQVSMITSRDRLMSRSEHVENWDRDGAKLVCWTDPILDDQYPSL